MAFIPVPGVAQFNLVMVAEGQVMENVFHIYNPSDWDIQSMAATATKIVNWWKTDLSLNVSAYVEAREIVIVDLTSQNAPGLEFTAGFPAQGAVGMQDMEPTSIAAVVKWLTAYRGRSFKGRTYFVGIPSNNCTVNTIAPAYREAVEQSYRNLFQLLRDDLTPMGVVSKYHNNQPRAIGLFTEIVGVAVGSFVGTQRRRAMGRGQ